VGEGIYSALEDHTAGPCFMAESHLWQRVEDKPGGLSPGSATFFGTLRGQQALEHALERARVILESSARCFRITVTVPFDTGWDMTPDDQVQLRDDRLPGGCITGKVVAVRLQASGDSGATTVTLTLAVSAGAPESSRGEIKKPDLSRWLYVEPEYGGGLGARAGQTASGMDFVVCVPEDTGPDVPGPGRFMMNAWGTGYATCWLPGLVKDVQVENSSFDQEKRLLEETESTTRRPVDILQTCPTRIRVRLRDLRPRGTIEQTVQAWVLQPWASPCGWKEA
jgi:hypothetical protein